MDGIGWNVNSVTLDLLKTTKIEIRDFKKISSGSLHNLILIKSNFSKKKKKFKKKK
jgi:hypothetical protein